MMRPSTPPEPASDSKRIAVIGSGYVGLVAGACLARIGHRVVCVDIDKERVAKLEKGKMPIYEPGLDTLVAEGRAAGRMEFTTDVAAAVATCDAVFIAVGTPPRKSDGEADLSYVMDSVGNLVEHIAPEAIIVTKSTVPVGTGDMIERLVRRRRPDLRIAVASNPEFLREGSAIQDFLEPDRVVIGCNDNHAQAVLSAIYAPLEVQGRNVLRTNRRSAELIKYASNAFLATKITFINEMSDLCEHVGADVADIARGMGLDQRIGPHFLHAGPGYGGSCFPKDTLALLRTAQEHGVNLRLVEQTVAANSARKRSMAQKVKHILHGNVDGKRIAVLGLTFKPDTDDMRDSPAIPVIELLQRAGAEIHAYDPVGTEQARMVLNEVTYYDDPYRCAKDADAVVFMTEWDVIKQLDLATLAALMRSPVMIDFRRIFKPEEAARHGFVVETIGRSGLEPHPFSAFDPAMLHSDIEVYTETTAPKPLESAPVS